MVAGHGKQRTRFDAENCLALCYGCHRWCDTHPDYKREWFVMRFGQARWEQIELRSRTAPMPDRQALKTSLQLSLKMLDVS